MKIVIFGIWILSIVLAFVKHRKIWVPLVFGLPTFGFPFFFYYLIVKSLPPYQKQKKVKENRILYNQKLQEYAKDNYLSKEELNALSQLQKELNLSDEDLKKEKKYIRQLEALSLQMNVAKYEEKFREVAQDNYLSQEEEQELKELQRKLQLTDAHISHTLQKLRTLKIISSIHDGHFPTIQCDVLMKKNEMCHFQIKVALMEEKSRTHYVGGSNGVSFRIARGVYWRTGGFKGERVTEKVNTITDEGFLYVTNKRVIFSGLKKNVTYPINKIVNIIKYSDAIQFQKENESRPKYFIVDSEDMIDIIGTLLTKIISETDN